MTRSVQALAWKNSHNQIIFGSGTCLLSEEQIKEQISSKQEQDLRGVYKRMCACFGRKVEPPPAPPAEDSVRGRCFRRSNILDILKRHRVGHRNPDLLRLEREKKTHQFPTRES